MALFFAMNAMSVQKIPKQLNIPSSSKYAYVQKPDINIQVIKRVSFDVNQAIQDQLRLSKLSALNWRMYNEFINLMLPHFQQFQLTIEFENTRIHQLYVNFLCRTSVTLHCLLYWYNLSKQQNQLERLQSLTRDLYQVVEIIERYDLASYLFAPTIHQVKLPIPSLGYFNDWCGDWCTKFAYYQWTEAVYMLCSKRWISTFSIYCSFMVKVHSDILCYIIETITVFYPRFEEELNTFAQAWLNCKSHLDEHLSSMIPLDEEFTPRLNHARYIEENLHLLRYLPRECMTMEQETFYLHLLSQRQETVEPYLKLQADTFNILRTHFPSDSQLCFVQGVLRFVFDEFVPSVWFMETNIGKMILTRYKSIVL